ncbi:hypothetical protein MASR2M8_13720 [Opitutaceae bacterium]
MNPPNLSPDDPRLTAYALGELEGADLAEVEAAVRANPTLQATIAEVRALAGELTDVLAKEPDGPAVEPRVDPYRRKIVRFPYYVVAGLAAACFAVMVVMHEDRPVEPELRTFELNFPSEVASAPAAPAGAVAEAAAFAAAAAADRSMAMRTAAPAAERLLKGFDSVPRRSGRADPGFIPASEAPRSGFVPAYNPRGYAQIFRTLESGGRPLLADVKIEDLLNHFSYDYAAPTEAEPVAAALEVASAPWNPAHRLVRIGLRARGEANTDGPASSDIVVRNTRVQVEFNPARVASYRLLGYESNSPVPPDTGGADLALGQTVTALYEIVPAASVADASSAGDLLTLTVAYQLPDDLVERQLDVALADDGADFMASSADFKFAAAVAGFGLILQDSPYKGSATYDEVVGWAEASLAEASNRAQPGVMDVERPAFTRLVRLVRGNNG